MVEDSDEHDLFGVPAQKFPFRNGTGGFAVNLTSGAGQMAGENVMLRNIALATIAVSAIALVGTAASGQLATEGGKRYVVQLSGANEVPPADSGATGTAVITVNRGQKRVCWDIQVTGQTATAAHIHIGLAGTAPGNNIVVHLDPDSGCTSTVTPGGAPISNDLFAALIQSPQVFYVNLHNAAFPAGFARGQLR